MNKKAVNVSLDNKGRYIIFSKVESSFLDYFKFVSKVCVNDVISAFYGGITSTFKKH